MRGKDGNTVLYPVYRKLGTAARGRMFYRRNYPQKKKIQISTSYHSPEDHWLKRKDPLPVLLEPSPEATYRESGKSKPTYFSLLPPKIRLYWNATWAMLRPKTVQACPNVPPSSINFFSSETLDTFQPGKTVVDLIRKPLQVVKSLPAPE